MVMKRPILLTPLGTGKIISSSETGGARKNMFYYYGDIHGNVRSVLSAIQHYGIEPGDTVVLLGDVGINYYGNANGDRGPKKLLNRTGITFFCIHGNHERRPDTLPYYHTSVWRGGSVFVEDEFPNLMFAKDGEVYDFDGPKAIVIGGAYSVDKYYRLARGVDWFADEQPSEETKQYVEQQLEKLGWKIDIVLTHTCPAKYIPVEAFLPGLDQSTVDRSTEDWLDTIEDRLSYSVWFCGHWHIDKSIDKLHFLFRGVGSVLPKGDVDNAEEEENPPRCN